MIDLVIGLLIHTEPEVVQVLTFLALKVTPVGVQTAGGPTVFCFFFGFWGGGGICAWQWNPPHAPTSDYAHEVLPQQGKMLVLSFQALAFIPLHSMRFLNKSCIS